MKKLLLVAHLVRLSKTCVCRAERPMFESLTYPNTFISTTTLHYGFAFLPVSSPYGSTGSGDGHTKDTNG